MSAYSPLSVIPAQSTSRPTNASKSAGAPGAARAPQLVRENSKTLIFYRTGSGITALTRQADRRRGQSGQPARRAQRPPDGPGGQRHADRPALSRVDRRGGRAAAA